MVLALLCLSVQLPYDAPAGWMRTVNPANGIVALAPAHPGLGRSVVLNVFNAEAFSGSAVDYHNGVVSRATTGARQLEPALHDTIGAFIVTAVHQLIPQGVVFARIYTVRWADKAQTFLLSTNTAAGFAKYVPTVDSMIRRITVPKTEAVVVTPALHPGPLDGVYLTLKNKGGMSFGVSKDFMIFFPDGQAFWHLPEEGLLDFNAAESHRTWNEFWGHYEMQGNRVHVTFNTGPDYSGVKNGDGTLLLGGYTYVHQTSGPDGRTLSGTYRAYNVGQDPSRDVTFYPDGRFEDRGIRAVVGALDLAYGRAKVPTGAGRGRYHIARYSIVFEYTDGRREQLSFYVPDDDGSTTAKQLVINTFNVLRVSP